MKTLFWCGLVFLVACAAPKQTSVSVYEPEAIDMVILQRTGCFGTCPIYKVAVFGNGIVAYEGKAYTDYEGKYMGQIDSDEAKKLFTRIHSLDWENYPAEYPIDNQDFPQFFINYKTIEIDKQVKGNTGAADDLISLSLEIDRIISTLNLQKQ
ncbi:MAG: hypothetical protein ISR01_02915 [Chitinophagales bacterium]|nr:hypothetical protein [Chitinophagales bacterium]